MPRAFCYSTMLLMLFDKKNKGVIKGIWIALSVLIIISMVLLYMPIF